jgi:phage terminase large subunit-like protein
MIKNTASLDGKGVKISLPQDPGAAGKVPDRDGLAEFLLDRVDRTLDGGEIFHGCTMPA